MSWTPFTSTFDLTSIMTDGLSSPLSPLVLYDYIKNIESDSYRVIVYRDSIEIELFFDIDERIFTLGVIQGLLYANEVDGLCLGSVVLSNIEYHENKIRFLVTDSILHHLKFVDLIDTVFRNNIYP